jgi:hypothetical protein
MMNEQQLYFMQKAAERLRNMANCCRGTVCDDDKVYGLEMEAAAIDEAIRLIRFSAKGSPPQRPSSPDKIDNEVYALPDTSNGWWPSN